MSDRKPGLFDHLLRVVNDASADPKRTPRQPRGLPSNAVNFVAYCARTRTPFLVLARRSGNRLRWISSTLLPFNHPPAGADAGPPMAMEQLEMDSAGWRCPICASDGFWQCAGSEPSSCRAFHCRGMTSRGKWLGGCGKCESDPRDARYATHFAVRVSERSDGVIVSPKGTRTTARDTAATPSSPAGSTQLKRLPPPSRY